MKVRSPAESKGEALSYTQTPALEGVLSSSKGMNAEGVFEMR
jgi:hypothetical protein